MEVFNLEYGFIYITTNNINNKKYIGKCKYKPGSKNYLGSGLHLKRAINKYGKENFSRDIIDTAKNENELNKKEKYWIDFYNAIHSDNFYNIAEGGHGGNTLAGKTEEELKQFGEIISNANKGRKWSDESKLNRSKERKGKFTGKDHHMFGKKLSDEQKKKISNKVKGGKNPSAKKVYIYKGSELIKVCNTFDETVHWFYKQYRAYSLTTSNKLIRNLRKSGGTCIKTGLSFSDKKLGGINNE
jgi:group I intron endonuclease